MQSGLPSSEATRGVFTSSLKDLPKFRGILRDPLVKLLTQGLDPPHGLSLNDDALIYIEGLLYQLLARLLSIHPRSIKDVEVWVNHHFKAPLNNSALTSAHNVKKKKIVFPADVLHHLLVKEIPYKIDRSVTLFISAILEHISGDVLRLAGKFVQNTKNIVITAADIEVALNADNILLDVLTPPVNSVVNNDDYTATMHQTLHTKTTMNHSEMVTYESTVSDFIKQERQYITDLQIIIKLFKIPFERDRQKFGGKKSNVHDLFCNIDEIYEGAEEFLSLLVDTVEMADSLSPDSPGHCVGSCFEGLVEAMALDPYIWFSQDVLHEDYAANLARFNSNPEFVSYLDSVGRHYRIAFQHLFPKGILIPIYHFHYYFDVLKRLQELTKDERDADMLSQSLAALRSTRSIVARNERRNKLRHPRVGEESTILGFSRSLKQPILRFTELQDTIEGWEGNAIISCCRELVREGPLVKAGQRKTTERYVFLFDMMVVSCKPIHSQSRRSLIAEDSSRYKYRLKEKFDVLQLSVVDLADSPTLRNCFEIVSDSPSSTPLSVIFVCRSLEEKSDWMTDLMCLQCRDALSAMLSSALEAEDRALPLRLPPTSAYRFTEPDVDGTNVVYDHNVVPPLFKGGTLLKLIERLTPQPALISYDAGFVRNFLTTYTPFCTPPELLLLLIERFNIPDPELTPSETQSLDSGVPLPVLVKFKKEYLHPVQLRVINVIRFWIDNHFYDFDTSKFPHILDELEAFLESVYDTSERRKVLRQVVGNLRRMIPRKVQNRKNRMESLSASEPDRLDSGECLRLENSIYPESPPESPPSSLPLSPSPNSIDSFIRHSPGHKLLSLSPANWAEQITLLDSDLYRAINPREPVEVCYRSKDVPKASVAPNIVKVERFLNNLSFWFQRAIVDTQNLDERVVIVSRIIDILALVYDFNNFNCVYAIGSALGSSAVDRLGFTWAAVDTKRLETKSNAELHLDHHKKYKRLLKSINPPCVPYFGVYATEIMQIIEGNKDKLHDDVLINVTKMRRIAAITGEIQQYQYVGYDKLRRNQDVIKFLSELKPFQDKSDEAVMNCLFEQSLIVEPRNSKKAPEFARSYTNSLLKASPHPSLKHHHSSSRSTITSTFTSSGTFSSLSSGASGSSVSSQFKPLTYHALADEDLASPVNGTGSASLPGTPVSPNSPVDTRFPSPLPEVEPCGPPPPLPPRGHRDSIGGDPPQLPTRKIPVGVLQPRTPPRVNPIPDLLPPPINPPTSLLTNPSSPQMRRIYHRRVSSPSRRHHTAPLLLPSANPSPPPIPSEVLNNCVESPPKLPPRRPNIV